MLRKLSNSSVLKWPNRDKVLQSLKLWRDRVLREHPEISRFGVIGSYARGDWGVGSDLDLIIIVKESDVPFESRSSKYALLVLPVPVDVLVYTEKEWENLPEDSRFKQTVKKEVQWIFPEGEIPCF